MSGETIVSSPVSALVLGLTYAAMSDREKNINMGKIYLIEDWYLKAPHSEVLPLFNDMLTGGDMTSFDDVGLKYTLTIETTDGWVEDTFEKGLTYTKWDGLKIWPKKFFSQNGGSVQYNFRLSATYREEITGLGWGSLFGLGCLIDP